MLQLHKEDFGSFRTGLYLPTSDIDVVILGSGITNPRTGLHALSRALSQRGIAKKMHVIAKARVPIVKFVEKKSGVAFDISFDVDNGPKVAEFIKEAVLKWPQLRQLCLILKVFLQQIDLNEVYSGRIGSYALLAMLMAMLQSLRESQTYLEHNLGMLLAPNDIGKNSFNYIQDKVDEVGFQIRSSFGMAFATLTDPKTILSLGPNGSILDDEEPLLRGDGNAGDVSAQSSGRRRKSSFKERHKRRKVKENGNVRKHEETDSKKERKF
ncbi:hypothetical protein REPUB_Repub11eG0058200 [Reevesia pubescens]